jgi:hypothetical protein
MVLKDFSSNYNINIFVVHHAILNNEMFDRILHINKEVFTSINEISTSTESAKLEMLLT